MRSLPPELEEGPVPAAPGEAGGPGAAAGGAGPGAGAGGAGGGWTPRKAAAPPPQTPEDMGGGPAGRAPKGARVARARGGPGAGGGDLQGALEHEVVVGDARTRRRASAAGLGRGQSREAGEQEC